MAKRKKHQPTASGNIGSKKNQSKTENEQSPSAEPQFDAMNLSYLLDEREWIRQVGYDH
jgi:hypothetical protein